MKVLAAALLVIAVLATALGPGLAQTSTERAREEARREAEQRQRAREQERRASERNASEARDRQPERERAGATPEWAFSGRCCM